MLHKSDKGTAIMTAIAAEMRDAIVTLAGPRGPHDTRESWLARAARRAGISYRQARTFFYGRTSVNPRISDVERVRAAVIRLGETNEQRIEALEVRIDELRRELADLRAAKADRSGYLAR